MNLRWHSHVTVSELHKITIIAAGEASSWTSYNYYSSNEMWRKLLKWTCQLNQRHVLHTTWRLGHIHNHNVMRGDKVELSDIHTSTCGWLLTDIIYCIMMWLIKCNISLCLLLVCVHVQEYNILVMLHIWCGLWSEPKHPGVQGIGHSFGLRLICWPVKNYVCSLIWKSMYVVAFLPFVGMWKCCSLLSWERT